jgi:hypothetical protein
MRELSQREIELQLVNIPNSSTKTVAGFEVSYNMIDGYHILIYGAKRRVGLDLRDAIAYIYINQNCW